MKKLLRPKTGELRAVDDDYMLLWKSSKHCTDIDQGELFMVLGSTPHHGSTKRVWWVLARGEVFFTIDWELEKTLEPA